MKTQVESQLLVREPDAVGEKLQPEYMGAALDGLVVDLRAQGHEPEAVERAAETLRKALAWSASGPRPRAASRRRAESNR